MHAKISGVNSTSRFHIFLLASAIAILSALLLLATSSSMTIAWDEGDTILRAEQIAQLAAESGLPDRPSFLNAIRREPNWPYTTQREGHPSLVGILVACGSSIAPSWFDSGRCTSSGSPAGAR